jgi:hypothetical protein
MRTAALTRIHGTTKRQVAAIFAEEQPALGPLPLEPFRYYRFGVRTVHLDGCVEVDAAYYGTPPGAGSGVASTCNGTTSSCGCSIRTPASCCGSMSGRRAAGTASPMPIGHDAHRRRPSRCSTRRCASGRRSSTICDHIHRHDGEAGVRRILGVLSLAKKHGPAVIEDAAKAALDLGVPTYRFLRRYLERRPPCAADAQAGRSPHSAAHPLRDLIDRAGDSQ